MRYQSEQNPVKADLFMPDFLLVGAHKAGTTAVADMLTAHPGIAFSKVKEPGFWHLHENPGRRILPNSQNTYASERFADPQTYKNLFAHRASHQLTGEASTVYLQSEHAKHAIAQATRKPKVIILLRNPAERAYSAYCYMRKVGLEPEQNFGEALKAEARRLASGYWHDYGYRRGGYYAADITDWQSIVGRENCLILPFEHVIGQTATCRALAAFLGLKSPLPRMQHANPSGLYDGIVSRKLASVVHRHDFSDRRWKQLVPEQLRITWAQFRRLATAQLDKSLTPFAPLPLTQKTALLAEYHNDIRQCEKLTGLPLSHIWLNGA